MRRINLEDYTDWIVPPPITEKYCRRCKQTKPVAEWNKNKLRADGYGIHCKECARHQVQVQRAAWRIERGRNLSPATAPYEQEARELLARRAQRKAEKEAEENQ